MDCKITNVFLAILYFASLSVLAVPEEVTLFQLEGPGNYTCVNHIRDDLYSRAANCTNGRGLFGCCVDRSYCDYSTPNIDLTIYAPRGLHSSCDRTLVCCPLQYVLPLKVTKSTVGDIFSDNSIDADDIF